MNVDEIMEEAKTRFEIFDYTWWNIATTYVQIKISVLTNRTSAFHALKNGLHAEDIKMLPSIGIFRNTLRNI